MFLPQFRNCRSPTLTQAQGFFVRLRGRAAQTQRSIASKKMLQTRFLCLTSVVFAISLSLGCESDTKLGITGGNPSTFLMSGNGFLTSIRVRGHARQRDAQGENQYLHWVVEVKDDGGMSVGSIGSVTYGKVPKGYQQIYPEKGEAPAIIEGQHYYVRLVTSNANGADGYFMVQNGKALFDPIESELPPETNASQ